MYSVTPRPCFLDAIFSLLRTLTLIRSSLEQ